MKIRTMGYHICEGCRSIFRNGLMSVASIASVSACAFMLIISLAVALNLDVALEKLEQNVGISIYLGESVSDDDTKYLFEEIQKIEHIRQVDYMTKNDALEWAMSEWGDDKGILKGLEEDNPFPRSFELLLDDIMSQSNVINSLILLQNDFELELVTSQLERQQTMIDTIENPLSETTDKEKDLESSEDSVSDIVLEDIIEPSFGGEGYEYKGIRTIRHSQDESEILISINSGVRVASIIILLLLSIISVGIIVNTIKITVYVRRNEINIMKYVGATDWFIRWPFVIEGIVIGIIGAVIPTILSSVGYGQLVSLIYEKLPIIINYVEFKDSISLFLIIAPITITLGGFLGVIGSVNAIKKHLKV